MTNGHEDQLVLSLSAEGVRFLRGHWSRLRELVRRQLDNSSTDPLAELTGLPVLTAPVDPRLASVIDFWCGSAEQGPVRQLWDGWLLHELEPALGRTLAALPRSGGLVRLPGPGHPVVLEWGCMLATLYVALETAGRMPPADLPACGVGCDTVPPWDEDPEDRRRGLDWLELVLETLVEAGRGAPARTV